MSTMFLFSFIFFTSPLFHYGNEKKLYEYKMSVYDLIIKIFVMPLMYKTHLIISCIKKCSPQGTSLFFFFFFWGGWKAQAQVQVKSIVW